ncbi:hypothetical protein [Streptomyces noursei]|uniref:hypothetical protein n=1 Tax=Streptomyces noursei TaxID=1971 RepID=UPI0035D8EADE
MFLELRHKVELHRMTGRAIECPIDEMNRPRGAKDAQLRIPPTGPEVGTLFTGWGRELATCRKFAPTARNYTAAKLMSQVGLRVSEACKLDLADFKWNLGRFGKLHVRHGKGARGSGHFHVAANFYLVSRMLQKKRPRPRGSDPHSGPVPNRAVSAEPTTQVAWPLPVPSTARCRRRRSA